MQVIYIKLDIGSHLEYCRVLVLRFMEIWNNIGDRTVVGAHIIFLYHRFTHDCMVQKWHN